MRALALGLVLATLGCGRGERARSPLEDIPLEATAVFDVDPAAVRGTWIETVVAALAPRVELPACVLARARTARRVIVAWAHVLPEDGVLIAIDGGEPTACPDLEERGATARWSHALAARADGDDGYFSDRTRRARLARLPRAPVRMLADHELSAGIVARVDATLDGRDGVTAAATVRFDAGAAADGARARLERWRATIDRERLGGATAAIDALSVRGPAPGTPTLELALHLRGDAGRDAASLLATAVIAGTYLDQRMPCPSPTTMQAWGTSCVGGEVRVPVATRDRMATLDSASAVLELRETAAGAPALALRNVHASSPLRALGLASDDLVVEVDGTPPTMTSLLALPTAVRGRALDSIVTARVIRAGRRITLRYRLVP